MLIPFVTLRELLSDTGRIGAPEPAARPLLGRIETDGGGNSEICLGFVPGRIEILGRHTDYAGGRSFVCAIDRGFSFAAVPRADNIVRLIEDSTEFPEARFSLDAVIPQRPGDWTNYARTMARRLVRNFGALAGVDLYFTSTLPVGSGMSGSSALMMMVFTALLAVNRFDRSPRFRADVGDALSLSTYLACAENGQTFRALGGDGGVGTFGGSEDHAAILNGRSAMASLFGFGPLALHAEIFWPSEWVLAVAFSGVRAEKTNEAMEKYNSVSRRAGAAASRYNQAFGTKCVSLADVADHMAHMTGDDGYRALRDRAGELTGLGDRVRQFVFEERVIIPPGVTALRHRDCPAFGQTLTESHRASAEWLGNIVPETEHLREAAKMAEAGGASGFGAGFGGSVVAIIRRGDAEDFLGRWRGLSARRFPERAAGADFFVTSPAPGIRVWTTGGSRRLCDVLF